MILSSKLREMLFYKIANLLSLNQYCDGSKVFF